MFVDEKRETTLNKTWSSTCAELLNYKIPIKDTKFEDLVGPQGGGTLEAQLLEIKNIGNQIGVKVSEERALELASQLFGKWTFYKGQIGSWKDYFNDEHKKLFKEVAGQLLIELGYETDDKW